MRSIATRDIGSERSWQWAILGDGTIGWFWGSILFCLGVWDTTDEDNNLFLVPPLNIALTSSQACTISSGGLPLSFICRLQELKLAASGWIYLSLALNRWEWNINLLGEKNKPQIVHLMHLALEELYLEGRKDPLHPQAHSWWTAKAKSSGSLGGALSPRKLLQRRSASLRVIMPHLRDDTGIAPARRRISSWTGVHWTQVIPKTKIVKN